jgi:beta-glucosidase
MNKKFPNNFIWGVGTSAIQAEGGNKWSDWAYFEKIKPFIKSGEKIGKTADHYKRYEEDLLLAKKLNQKAYRFTIEWSRIEKRPGIFDHDEINHYRDVIKLCHKLGIEPFPTLHHFSNPTWFTKSGGWDSSKSSLLFRRYVEYVANKLGDSVQHWLTINEPNTYIGLGYLTGIFPPLKHNPVKAHQAIRNLAKAHNLAYDVLKNINPRSQVGAVVNIQLKTSAGGKCNSPLQKVADYYINFFFLSKTNKKSDFIGLNYYFPTRLLKKATERTDMGWEIYPKGLYDSVMETWRRYKLPIYITENGIADKGDMKRAEYIRSHLACLLKAIAKGADVRGYFYWTLLDNLELAEGYWPKFGLIEVNFKTMERKIKNSALKYAKICQKNEL